MWGHKPGLVDRWAEDWLSGCCGSECMESCFWVFGLWGQSALVLDSHEEFAKKQDIPFDVSKSFTDHPKTLVSVFC